MVNVKAQRYNGAGQAVSELDVGFSLPLPLLNQKKYSSGVLEAQKGLENAQHEFDARQTEALGLVRDQLKKIQTAANQYELYRDKLVPLANETVEASRAAYEAATGGFLELITARRTLQDIESMALNRLAEYEVAIAELEAITGNPTSDQSGKDISK
jgi:outer membrane protein, heavy metal efflux system